MRRKLKDTGGFSFVEMLCAVAILVLLCLMMNTGIGMAVKSYQAITAESEAQLLISSLSDALTDKLRYCVVTEKTVTLPGGATTETYPLSIGEVEVVEGKAVVNVGTDAGGSTIYRALLPNGAYGASGKFSTGYIGRYTVAQVNPSTPLVAFNPTTNSFLVRFTVTDEQLKIERKAEFTVRCLNPVKKEV